MKLLGSYEVSAGVLALAIILSLLLVVHYVSTRKIHPQEPVVIAPWIPGIGHALGMSLYGARYYKFINKYARGEPIFTLPVPGARVYIIADPSLASIVQRNTKALSFSPIISAIIKRVLGMDDRAVHISMQNLDPGPGDPKGYIADNHDMVYTSLGPGLDLDKIMGDAMREFGQRIGIIQETLSQASAKPEPVNLMQWVRDLVTFGSAAYNYGPGDPFAKDESLGPAFWDFDTGIGQLMLGIAPTITARKAYYGRERVVAALKTYFESGHQTNGSVLAQRRLGVDRLHDQNLDASARTNLSFLFATIVNETAVTFWLTLRFAAEPALLAQVRQEVANAIAESEATHGSDTWDVESFRRHCPTILASFREVIRQNSENLSARVVKEDVQLSDRYYLKKDNVVLLSGGIMHANESIWGQDADLFHVDRFSPDKTKGANAPAAAFRGFGGGVTMCPGKHFATSVTLMIMVFIVHSLDITTPDGKLPAVPKKDDSVMPIHVLQPKPQDCPQVIISARKGASSLKPVKIVV